MTSSCETVRFGIKLNLGPDLLGNVEEALRDTPHIFDCYREAVLVGDDEWVCRGGLWIWIGDHVWYHADKDLALADVEFWFYGIEEVLETGRGRVWAWEESKMTLERAGENGRILVMQDVVVRGEEQIVVSWPIRVDLETFVSGLTNCGRLLLTFSLRLSEFLAAQRRGAGEGAELSRLAEIFEKRLPADLEGLLSDLDRRLASLAIGKSDADEC